MTDSAYQKIMVAVDGSTTAERALDEAIRVARLSGAQVLAIYVVDNGQVLFDAGYYDPTQLRNAFVESGKRALEDAAQRLKAAAVAYETRLVDEPAVVGDVAGSLNGAAEAWGADLIVLGTHGRRGVRRLVLGSVAEEVIRESTLPVLLVRGTAPA
ncbi:universal stress protein UspA [Cupriavidus sp. USMAA2-4]|uniref:Universal stress protein n=1 Tax=Cupriavidus malaysiensis TaxID=367825 RepID=A0ABN4TRR2_9BURK|nr:MULTISPECIES: universal stress protein [Cupriavidus]AOY92454.1 universal stress protein UspA [Cupriavidus sp. USMAA2-4]AOY97963.1 universal stress protein UspA [Cupriavidus sp. USMAHM13]AOZ07838.1 universal stress protein UspA [Cupriavidus malaysiensis]